MDYEQKYKEAVEWMRGMYDGLHGKTKKEAEKSKWTDEDEERLQSCIITLQGNSHIRGVDTIDTKWLKSLKQRMEQ